MKPFKGFLCIFLSMMQKHSIQDEIKKHVIERQNDKDAKWDWYAISKNPIITWEIVTSNPDIPWNWWGLSANPNITWDIVKDNPEKTWKMLIGSSMNPQITWDIVTSYPDVFL